MHRDRLTEVCLVRSRVVELGAEVRSGPFVSTSLADHTVFGDFEDLTFLIPDARNFQSSYQVGDFGGLISFGDVLESSDNETFLVTSLGGDLEWLLEDGTVAYLEKTGNYQLSARLIDLWDGAVEASAGLIVRDGLSEGAPFVAIYRSLEGELTFASRVVADASVNISSNSTVTLPRYLRISHVDGVVEAEQSEDGHIWTVVGSLDIGNTQFSSPLVGLFASGLNSSAPVQSVWDSVEVTDIAPGFPDSDSDGMPDDFENLHGLNPNNPDDAGEDIDADGLSNLLEFQAGTDPREEDSDSDGLLDGEEIVAALDPNFSDAYDDPDGDRYPSLYEIRRGSDPLDSEVIPAADIIVRKDGLGDYTTVQEALYASETAPDFPIILVEEGIYHERLSYAGTKIPFLVSGSGAASTLVDAQGLGKVFDIRSPLAIDGFTLTGGFGNGAGLYVWNTGEVQVSHCVISDNGNGAGSGAVYVGYAKLFLKDSVILSNEMAAGGAIRVYINGNVFLSHVTISFNIGGDSDGVLVFDASGKVDVSNSIVWNGDSS